MSSSRSIITPRALGSRRSTIGFEPPLSSTGMASPFEALSARMGADTTARERAQLALDRLQDPQGYDLWWLREFAAQPRWYVVFPFLTASTIAAVAALPFVSAAKIAVVVVLVVNLIVRYATDARVGALGEASGSSRRSSPPQNHWPSSKARTLSLLFDPFVPTCRSSKDSTPFRGA